MIRPTQMLNFLLYIILINNTKTTYKNVYLLSPTQRKKTNLKREYLNDVFVVSNNFHHLHYQYRNFTLVFIYDLS